MDHDKIQTCKRSKLPYTAEEEVARDAAEAKKADIAANGYKRVRQGQYPSLPEQLDLLIQ